MPATTRNFVDKKMGDLHTKAHAGKHGAAIRKIGFYGCNNKVVRVELQERPARGQAYPLRIRLECPACTHEHDVKPLWREYKPSLDDGKEAVLL